MIPQEQTPPRQTGITGITIENFKGIGAPVTIPLRPITLLFGANSAGKSTIIQALHYARELLERNNPDADIPQAGGNAIDFGGFRNLVHKHDLGRAIQIRFEITPDDDGLPGLDDVMGLPLEYDTGYWQTLESSRLFHAHFPDLGALLADSAKLAASRGRFELLQKNQQLIKDRPPDISSLTKTVSLQLSVAWDASAQRPWLKAVAYSLNGVPLFTITQENLGAIPAFTTVNYAHPTIKEFFTPVLAELESTTEDAPPEDQSHDDIALATAGPESVAAEFRNFFDSLADTEGRVLLKGQKRALSDLSAPLPLGVSLNTEEGNYGYEFWIAAIVNQIILGSTFLLKKHLADFRYLGPIRVKPDRHHHPPSLPDEARWADGSAAWDLLLRHCEPHTPKGQAFVQEVSQWMAQEDRLDLGYSFSVGANRPLPQDSPLWANLNLLRQQYDEKDEEFYRKAIWAELEKISATTSLQFTDLKNQVPVGPADIGMGVLQVVPVIAAALDPKTKSLAVEQPELHLHPSAQARMGDLFVTQAKKDRLFLIETHSETLMLRIFRRIRETKRGKLPRPELEIARDSISLLYVATSNAGTSITPIRLDEQGKFADQIPGGFFEEGFDELF